MKQHILALVRDNAPCYLYEYDVMKRQVETLRGIFPGYDRQTNARDVHAEFPLVYAVPA